MIDLNSFNSEKQIAAPVVNNQFTFQGKKYRLSNCVDGWYQIIISGNKARIDKLINVETCKRCKASFLHKSSIVGLAWL